MQGIKNNLSKKLKEYVEIILDEYHDYIPKERQDYLKSIKDFTSCIEIADTGTISCLCGPNNKIYFPTLAFSILELFKSNPKYKTDPNHKCYNESNLIVNHNTFLDYVNHAIVAGLSPEEYFQENLLHESMHFCGIGAAGDPLKEGLTELKTRFLAKKRGLKTSGCGYPKEIEIVLRLQNIFGEDTMNKIAFSRSDHDISQILMKDHGVAAENLYFQVLQAMKTQFNEYIHTSYNGPDAPMKKVLAYDKLNYQEAHRLIDEYCQKTN